MLVLTVLSSFPRTQISPGSGLNDSPTAASFFRPAKPSDKSQSFLEAMKQKYDPDEDSKGPLSSKKQIRISGKPVQEIGFDEMRRQLAVSIPKNGRIVDLDGLRIQCGGDGKFQDELNRIKIRGLFITDLNLSRNLLEEWSYVLDLCSALGQPLQSLRLE